MSEAGLRQATCFSWAKAGKEMASVYHQALGLDAAG
jgi:hypothetical protein